ncbi:MAG TPA: YggT family protein [Thermoanaerobaculia bacterium]|nr:YggT family protein [Thermoanaerobaculia bacterium]
MGILVVFYDALMIVLQVIQWIVLVWVILSWVLFFASQTSFRWRYKSAYVILNQLNDIFTRMTSPFLRPFRRLVPPHKMGGIDWSPLLLLLAIYILRGVLDYLFRPLLLRG